MMMVRTITPVMIMMRVMIVIDNFFQIIKMAKSLRSKWKRKMRAIKSVRYGEKVKKILL